MINRLPYDIVKEILSKLDDESMLNCCIVLFKNITDSNLIHRLKRTIRIKKALLYKQDYLKKLDELPLVYATYMPKIHPRFWYDDHTDMLHQVYKGFPHNVPLSLCNMARLAKLSSYIEYCQYRYECESNTIPFVFDIITKIEFNEPIIYKNQLCKNIIYPFGRPYNIGISFSWNKCIEFIEKRKMIIYGMLFPDHIINQFSDNLQTIFEEFNYPEIISC